MSGRKWNQTKIFASGANQWRTHGKNGNHRSGKYRSANGCDCQSFRDGSILSRSIWQNIEGLTYVKSPEEIFQHLRCYQLTCTLNGQTQHLINKESLKLFQPTCPFTQYFQRWVDRWISFVRSPGKPNYCRCGIGRTICRDNLKKSILWFIIQNVSILRTMPPTQRNQTKAIGYGNW